MAREHLFLRSVKHDARILCKRLSQNRNGAFCRSCRSGEITVFSETWTKIATAGSIEVMGNVVEGSA